MQTCMHACTHTHQVRFHDVYGTDEELLAMVPTPAYAVLVCFPLTAKYRQAAGEADASSDPAAHAPYFMHQSVPNACGTVAMVHAYANLPEAHKAAAGGSGWLQAFVHKTSALDAMRRAVYLCVYI